QNGSALGTAPGGAVTINGTSVLQLVGGITIGNKSLTLNSTADANGALENVSGNNSWSGPISLQQTTTMGVDHSTDVLTLSGVISGPGGLTKVGPGIELLSRNNSYTGTTTVDDGTLVIDGSQTGSAVTVDSGGTLAGIGVTGPLTVNSGGTVLPGVSSPGTLFV